MLNLFAGPKLQKHDYVTKRGVCCPMFHREGTSDWNTLMAALQQDEYHLNDLDLRPGGIAVDIGSHIGGISVLLATLGLHVYSVEALPENARLQKKNIALNKLTGHIEVLQRAIAGQNGVVKKIYYGSLAEESGRHHEFIGTSADFKHAFGKGRFTSVKTISVEEIFKKYHVQECEILKIDVEGAEWEALAEVPEPVLARIRILLGEWHPHAGNNCRQQIFALTRGLFVDVSERFGAPANDFIFIRKERTRLN